MPVPELSLTEERIVLLSRGRPEQEGDCRGGRPGRTHRRLAPRAGGPKARTGIGPPRAGPRTESSETSDRDRRKEHTDAQNPDTCSRGSTALLVVAASVLAVTASAQSGAANHRARPFHLTKTCPPSQYQGQIGGYCTVTSSNVAAIAVGTKIFYAQAAGPTSLDSDVILYVGPGNTATGHCALILRPASGGARCRAEPGGSTASMLVSTSRTSAGTTGPGTGRTGSATTRTRSRLPGSPAGRGGGLAQWKSAIQGEIERRFGWLIPRFPDASLSACMRAERCFGARAARKRGSAGGAAVLFGRGYTEPFAGL